MLTIDISTYLPKEFDAYKNSDGVLDDMLLSMVDPHLYSILQKTLKEIIDNDMRDRLELNLKIAGLKGPYQKHMAMVDYKMKKKGW